MSPAQQIARLESQLAAERDKAEINSREDQHWYQKFMRLKEAVDEAIDRSNGQDPAMTVLISLDARPNPKRTLEEKIAQEIQLEFA